MDCKSKVADLRTKIHTTHLPGVPFLFSKQVGFGDTMFDMAETIASLLDCTEALTGHSVFKLVTLGGAWDICSRRCHLKDNPLVLHLGNQDEPFRNYLESARHPHVVAASQLRLVGISAFSPSPYVGILPLRSDKTMLGALLVGLESPGLTAKEAKRFADFATLAGEMLMRGLESCLLVMQQHISQLLHRSLDLQTVVQDVCTAVQDAFGSGTGCTVLLLDPATRWLEVVASSHIGKESWALLGHSADEGLDGVALESGRPVAADDLTQDERVIRSHAVLSSSSAAIVAPMVNFDRKLGVLEVTFRERRVISDLELHFVGQVAEHVAVAIEHALQHGEIARAAFEDVITGAQSRRALHLFLEQAESIQRGAVAVLMLDLDHFKLVNDKYGHAVGDAVLAQLGTVLREQIREHDHWFRYGGEEFAVVMPGVAREQVGRVAERIRQAVEACTDPATTVSIGAVWCEKDQDLQRMLAAADEALYEAKREGRNRVVIREFGGEVQDDEAAG